MFVEWSDRYQIGVGPMDEAHKKLMGLMNQLHEQRAAGDDKGDLRKTLKALADFTIRHFREEEAFMQSIAFPGLENHKRIHGNLLGQLTEHLNAFEAGAGPLPDQFFTFLKVWLTAHICGIDTKYAEHSRGKR
jgi:hemerythrin